MRCFIAVDLGKDVKEYLGKIQEKIPREAKIKPVNHFHITLFFLGEIPPSKVEEVKEVLLGIKFKKIKARLNKIDFFPSESYIRVIYVGLSNADDLYEIQRVIAKKIEALGIKQDKEFKAHITLARVKGVRDRKSFVKKLKEIKPEKLEVVLKKITLYESKLTRDGPIYKELLSIEAE